MTDFNLSKTEFIAYLTCPLKFYLIKSGNYNLPYGPRGERDYSSFSAGSQDGMKWHAWLEAFHEKYFEDIRDNNPAPTSEKKKDTEIMGMFYEKEKERYKKQSKYWNPLTTELYLESEHFRGEIDRIDQLNEQGDCLLVEYKRQRKEFDEQELLFYACLINQVGGKIPDVSYLIRVKEIEVYYYETGESYRRKLLDKELTNFELFIKAIREEIFSPNWIRKENCDILSSNCDYREICFRVPDGLLKQAESQKSEQ